jgi:pimeloyl-ACP methyl ester carboxylesterase
VSDQRSDWPAPIDLADSEDARRAIPVVFGAGPNQCAGFYHPAIDDPAGEAVLICAPWGWDEVASYRPRRRLAEFLAGEGHPTLRFDLPGTGDSTGEPDEPEVLEAWITAIESATGWLRGLGAERVAVVGLGLGGLLAREAVRRGLSVEDLVIWGAPASGRAFVREIKAFARLQTSRGDDAGALPEGWQEVGGYVLAAATLAALKALPAEVGAPPSLSRALLMKRDGVGGDESFAEALRDAGVEVAVDEGEGWSGVINHPESSMMPPTAASRIARWLEEAAPPPTYYSSVEGSPALTLPDGVVETPFVFRREAGDLYGVLAMPATARDDGLCAVLLNAGAIQHTGPNRLWTEAARRWAAAGVPTLRLDLEGIGEADGDEWRMHETGDFYELRFVDQVIDVLDALTKQGIGERFLCAGLCSGAYWSVQAALADERVEAVVMLNGGALSWHERLAENRAVHRFDRVFSLDWWQRLLRGGIRRPSVAEFASVLRARLRGLWRTVRAKVGPGGKASGPIASDLDRLRARDVRVVLAFSGGEALARELTDEGVAERLDEWPNVVRRTLPGNDHTLRSLPAQEAAAEILDAELNRAAAAAKPQSP